jgi:hypothetical protein
LGLGVRTPTGPSLAPTGGTRLDDERRLRSGRLAENEEEEPETNNNRPVRTTSKPPSVKAVEPPDAAPPKSAESPETRLDDERRLRSWRPAEDEEEEPETNNNRPVRTTSKPPSVKAVEPPDAAPKSADSTETRLDDERRFRSWRLATMDDLGPYRTDLLIERESPCPIRLKCAPMEFYSAANLEERPHQFLVEPADTPQVAATATIVERNEPHFYSDDFSVLRDVFEEEKDDLKLPFDKFATWVMKGQNGPRDHLRDTAFEYNERMDGGVGGAAPGEKDAKYSPDRLCGEKHFSKDDEGDSMRYFLGCIMDRMQDMSDTIAQHQGLPKSFPNKARDRIFGKKVRQSLFAKKSRYEWWTIQLKCVSKGRGGSRHKDSQNDPRKGYHRTDCFSCFFIDDCGDLWSLKILGNSRKRCGDFMPALKSFHQLSSNVQVYLDDLNAGYVSYLEGYEGPNPPELSWILAENFRLDDGSPWKIQNVKTLACLEDLEVECIDMPTSFRRDFWLSAAVDAIMKLKTIKGLNERSLLELALAASYQFSFYQFRHVCEQLGAEEGSIGLLEYSDLSDQIFGKFTGGPDGRYSSSGHIATNLRKLEGEGGKALSDGLDALSELLNWFNAQPNDKELDIGTLQVQYSKTLQKVSPALEMQEFRLQVFVQICFLAKIGVRGGGKKALSTAYPVIKKSSYLHLVDIAGVSPSPTDMQQAMDQMAMEYHMVEPGRNILECILCESVPARRKKRYDIFFRGQALYMLSKEGFSLRKSYGEATWEKW